MTIKNAQISYNDNGTPVAEAFGDVYFSDYNGLEETQYVFLLQNDMPGRFRLLQDDDDFTVLETGFGTGLNFLTCWQALDGLRHQQQRGPGRLHFISTEKYPLSRHDLQQALAQWPQLARFSQQLTEHYPDLTPGCHRLVFNTGEYQLILDLHFGDIEDVLPDMYCPETGLADAWFLDGFAPSKNPDMWTDKLYRQMVRLAKPGCTFATFTAAGAVRRGLQQAGFDVRKCPGFGRKRDMLAGRLNHKPAPDIFKPWYQRRAFQTQEIAVVGGGLAGANLCYALCHQGYRVSLYTERLAGDASGNPQGGFYPQLHTEGNISSHFMAQAFGYAQRLYRYLAKTDDFAHQFCGVLQLGFNPKEQARLEKLAARHHWPDSLIRPVSASEASDIAGLPITYPGLFIPKGGWINPQGLIQTLLKACGNKLQIHTEKRLNSVTRQKGQWYLQWQDCTGNQSECVVLATGAQSITNNLLSELPLRPVRGQVEAVPSQPPLDELKTVLCHKGYLTPALNGHHALGSTYVKNDLNTDYREEEKRQNLNTHYKALSECDWIQQLTGIQHGRASIRLSTPDHLPIMGAIADFNAQRQSYAELRKGHKDSRYPPPEDLPGLFVFCGLGSRGLCTAPILAEALACQLSGKPMPLDSRTLAALNPNRFLIRELIRQPG
ncbi:bifunctional tRNA (5-methylaminomethyl-2-thiouridine)(34)-methyltransferase MnmD/FAD-dependent 5-carboxymethylaminomethyl-2-thiouridine(34) oxidoreductase MnmC [Lacimicrobium alkaliphilum]|uniref:tRNA 5-methylaminomethyl-2-thiouridine biosynthesis bifunctional protein MnmC n=1 Tax=Lacimicrobium alkaliphilum TaxID=1526571 RepID=A0ABQ1RG64_9ALTE|nr:bifunctional tRNA (5-methylaminomethyl-2-thiouridine)(34)-methyltransferase MnmD/FAD-dependent 5-carboxymethylaminomethyl-2-thiouridine(34) oxidoreductase MnmC [Lacimicrobium alkaliphilum]GGD67296.1 tRNA 5-methylaminomethyl-2-thiouridine biosynthesis bifunctional protein MnmC [Lacimicrobium alkaliphilum]